MNEAFLSTRCLSSQGTKLFSLLLLVATMRPKCKMLINVVFCHRVRCDLSPTWVRLESDEGDVRFYSKYRSFLKSAAKILWRNCLLQIFPQLFYIFFTFFHFCDGVILISAWCLERLILSVARLMLSIVHWFTHSYLTAFERLFHTKLWQNLYIYILKFVHVFFFSYLCTQFWDNRKIILCTWRKKNW